MGVVIRQYEGRDFAKLYKLDQACFERGIAYSKCSLHYFLSLPTSDCLVAEENKRIAGFILAETNPPLAHIITLDVEEGFRRRGVGTALLEESEKHFRYKGVRSVLLETSVENEPGIAFWRHHGYCEEARLKNYYLGKVDALEMRKRLEGNR